MKKHNEYVTILYRGTEIKIPSLTAKKFRYKNGSRIWSKRHFLTVMRHAQDYKMESLARIEEINKSQSN